MDDTLKHLRSLNAFTLVTTGRTGSDFLQSLIDSHPQVLTFNGNIIDYYDFWKTSKCVKAGNFDLSDFIWEFIGAYIERFKSQYDYGERKDQLGENFNQRIDINLHQFSKYFINIMNGNTVNSKNCLLAIYGAYAMAVGQDIDKKKIFFHHIHHHEKLDCFIKDFRDTRIISMTRDPRANITSGVCNHKKYNPESMNGAHQYFYINRILKDARALKIYNNDFISIKLEGLGRENTLKQLVAWLGIEYSEILKKSTWAGLIWNGDRLSQKKRQGVGFSKEMLNNNWEDILSKKDKYIFNHLMNKRLEHYDYSFSKISVISYLLIPFLNILPLSYEKDMLSISFIFKKAKKRNLKLIISNYYYYLKRIILFQRYYWKTVKKEPFDIPYLG